MSNKHPILCLDFDGVVHQYTSPWTKATEIHDGVTPGFFEWAEKAAPHFTLVVYSSRSKEPGGIDAMKDWLWRQRSDWMNTHPVGEYHPPVDFTFAHEKPTAFLTIDDRAVLFTGSWGSHGPEKLLGFKPWNRP